MTLDEINVTSNVTIYPSYIEYIPISALSNGSHSVSLEVKSTKGFSDIENWTFNINPFPFPPGGGGSGGGFGSGGIQKIMFASNRSGNFDLWVMNLDGSGLQQITFDSSNESSPAWIESKLVYVSDKYGSKDIWSMDINGLNNKPLTNSVLEEDMSSWSYVGGIIYSAGKDGSYNLEAMNTDGTGKIKLSNSSASDIEPAHSLMYYSWEQGILFGSVTKEGSGVYLMNFEEIGPKVKFWKLNEGYSLQAVSIDAKSEPVQTWLNLKRNGITKDDSVIRVGDSFSLMDKEKIILTAALNKTSSSENYYEIELVNVTQYSSIDGTPLFTNKTKILVNKILLNELTIEPTPTSTPISNGVSGGSSGTSGGGGGGGGAPSDEDFKNIDKQESRDVDIHLGSNVYRFMTQDILKEIGFEAKKSEGLITAKIELLKSRPKKAASDAPGSVYRYFNVVVGTSGYGASSKLENAYIVFRVPEGWLKGNNVDSLKLMKFKDNIWIDLKTEKIGADTYKAYTPGFSGFAIVGIPATTGETPGETITPSVTAPQTAGGQAEKVAKPRINLVLIMGALAVGIIVVVQLKRKYSFRK